MAALVPGGSIAVITIPGQRNLDDRMAGVAYLKLDREALAAHPQAALEITFSAG